MVSIEPGTIWIKRQVHYDDPVGSVMTIPAGSYRILPVEMKDIMDDEVELECWVIRENEGTGQEIDRIVDCHAVEQWLGDGDIELS
jgi:hypothetical protein